MEPQKSRPIALIGVRTSFWGSPFASRIAQIDPDADIVREVLRLSEHAGAPALAVLGHGAQTRQGSDGLQRILADIGPKHLYAAICTEGASLPQPHAAGIPALDGALQGKSLDASQRNALEIEAHIVFAEHLLPALRGPRRHVVAIHAERRRGPAAWPIEYEEACRSADRRWSICRIGLPPEGGGTDAKSQLAADDVGMVVIEESSDEEGIPSIDVRAGTILKHLRSQGCRAPAIVRARSRAPEDDLVRSMPLEGLDAEPALLVAPPWDVAAFRGWISAVKRAEP